MTDKSKYREPEMGDYGGHAQWNCRWPGCEFDTLDEAAWTAHIDPQTGAHREPLGLPGELPHPLGAADLAELDELRAFKAAAEAPPKAAPPPEADAPKGATKKDG